MKRDEQQTGGIEITPDFDRLYAMFKREALQKAADLFADMPEHDSTDMAEKHDAFQAVVEVLVPIAICINSAATGSAINDMRGWLNDIVKDMNAKVARLDAELSERADLRVGGVMCECGRDLEMCATVDGAEQHGDRQ